MAIHFVCPACNKAYHAPDHAVGHKGSCSHCHQRIQVPPPVRNKTVLGRVLPSQPQPSTQTEGEVIDAEVAPARRDERCHHSPRRNSRRGEWECRHCGSHEYMIRTQYGVPALALLIVGIFVWPLLIAAIFVKENVLVCEDCGLSAGKVGNHFN